MKMISKELRPEFGFVSKFTLLTLCSFVMTFAFTAFDVQAAQFQCGVFFDSINEGSGKGASVEDSDSYCLKVYMDDEEIGRIYEEKIKSESYRVSIDPVTMKRIPEGFFPNLSAQRRYDLLQNISYDHAVAEDLIRDFDYISSLPDEPALDVEIIKNDDGVYELFDNSDSLKDKQKLIDYILDALESGKTSVDISDFDYDMIIPYTEEQTETIAFFDNVQRYQNAEITIEDQGNKCQLESSAIADLLLCKDDGALLMGKDGMPLLSEGKLSDICEKIEDDFTSIDSVIYWKKHNGGTVSLNCGKYGVEVDGPETLKLIKESITSGLGYEGPPVYTKESEDNHVGDTYVEVDMTAQHMYFFKDGKLYLDSDVVTGNKAHHNDTPETIEPIYFMQRNRVLVGDNYRTPVKYWMAFHNHVGLHDANWRSKFGGDIYKTDGSHGCVNLPVETAAKLYENVEVGTPVITYY